MPATSGRTGPLSGVTVIDTTRHMAGPYGAALLGDYGAEVIKVEPLHGDQARRIGRDFIDGESGLFLTWNRSKRSIALDYQSAKGRSVLMRLIANADVFLHNFRPATAKAAGLDFETLSEVNRSVVYCSVSGFGTEGPWANRPATDPVIQAMSGVMGVTGERDGSPALVGVPIADFTGAMFEVIGVLMGLRDRDRSGQAQEVEVSMLAGLMSALTTRLSSILYGGYEPVAMGSSHSAVTPYEAYQASDGYVVAGAWGEAGWGRFCAAVGLPEMARDARFETNQSRLDNRAELKAILDGKFRQRTCRQWEEAFAEADGLFGHVYSVSDALQQEQVVACGLLTEVQHSKLGSLTMLAPPIKMSSHSGALAGPPLLGEHTIGILHEAGYTTEEIDDLLESAVVSASEQTHEAVVGDR